MNALKTFYFTFLKTKYDTRSDLISFGLSSGTSKFLYLETDYESPFHYKSVSPDRKVTGNRIMRVTWTGRLVGAWGEDVTSAVLFISLGHLGNLKRTTQTWLLTLMATKT